jgi:hypothetical protein
MKRVYLDQKDWINLSRADRGLPSGREYCDALLVARAGVEQGLVSFPLSVVHYMEVHHRGDWKSRHALADLMGELSRFHTIASPTTVVPAEIDHALKARLGRPTRPRPLRVFGVGLRHAAGDDSFQFRVPDEFEIDEATKIEFEHAVANDFELGLLRGPGLNAPVPWFDPWAHTKVEQTYHQSEEALSKKLRDEGYSRGDKLRRAMLASGLMDILDPLNEALARARITVDDGLGDTREELTEFLRDVRSRWVLYEMRRDLHARGHHEAGDMRDLAALSVAVAYCDIVVTEKQWVHVLTTAKVDEMMQTTLLSNVKVLPEALV